MKLEHGRVVKAVLLALTLSAIVAGLLFAGKVPF